MGQEQTKDDLFIANQFKAHVGIKGQFSHAITLVENTVYICVLLQEFYSQSLNRDLTRTVGELLKL